MARQLSATLDMESLRYPSWCLSRLLDKIIGTEDAVRLTRKRIAMYSYISDVGLLHEFFISGSKGEGFNFQSSDFDYMYIDRRTIVLESLHSVDDDRKTALLLIREGCNPGFVILLLLNETNNGAIRKSLVEYHGHPVVSSLLYRDVHRVAERGEIGHGPCNSFCHMCEEDIAYCFKCDKWPAEAEEFIYRQRLYGWPQKSLLDKIISRGCHLVPVGDKNPDLSHIQWRLSFSAAEKDLVHSFNHTQFLVYGLLKIFLKQFIDKFLTVKDLLCSYFLKTAMFFSIENTPPSFWRDDLILPCFWFCLNKIIQWVEQGYCPNYFVLKNNMFRNKVFGENQQNLLTVLKSCNHVGWGCLCECEFFQRLENFINHSELFHNVCIPGEEERELDSDAIPFVALRACSIATPMHFARGLGLLRHSRTQEEDDISTLLLYSKLRMAGLTYACISGCINNKDKYKNTYRLLLMSAKSNACSGSLYLATFYYITGQYRKAVQLCNRVISHWKPYVLYASTPTMAFNKDMYMRYVCGRGVSVCDKAKLAFAFDIILTPSLKHFFPAELHYDIQASAPFYVVLPPIPYTLFLSFLCHHNIGNIDDSVTALHDLQDLLLDEQQGCISNPIVLNMWAVCLEKLGDVRGAIEACLLSQSEKPDKNGAEKMLDNMLCKYSGVKLNVYQV